MPTGFCVRRRAETGFKRERDVPPGTSVVCREWLAWLSHVRGISIRHKFNNTEKKIGEKRLPVDGYDALDNKVYQMHGCWFHSHDCYLTKGKPVNSARRTATLQKVKGIN